jgi:hypothetical protein
VAAPARFDRPLRSPAKRPQYHALSQDVPNLHTFVLPETLGIFLYIISFSPTVIEPTIVRALKNITTLEVHGRLFAKPR